MDICIHEDHRGLTRLTLPTLQELMLPEKEEYRIELFKDERKGLGITVAGYVCEKGKQPGGSQGEVGMVLAVTVHRVSLMKQIRESSWTESSK